MRRSLEVLKATLFVLLCLNSTLGFAGERAPRITGPKKEQPGKAQPAKSNFEQRGHPQFRLKEMGPNSRTWETDADQKSAGDKTKNKGRVVEIATGMNYWNGEKWVPSEASFEVKPATFEANRIQHKLILGKELNAAGSVSMTSPDGIQLRSTPIGIGLYDPDSGQSVLVASIQKCAGELIAKNQILYREAFQGKGVKASILYTVEQGSFEQDIILTTQLNPSDYGLPTNSFIQVFTEFFDSPEPDRIRRPIRVEADRERRLRMATPDFVDEVIGFGEAVFGTGRAFSTKTAGAKGDATIAKQFTKIQNRQFLIESVEFPSVAKQILALPRAVAATSPKNAGANQKLSALKLPVAGINDGKVERFVASADAPAKPEGLVLDYIVTIGGSVSTATTFASDTTYYVSGAAYYSGSVTIEGGAVFKYRNSTGGTSPANSFIQVSGSLTCKTAQYAPAVFTAGDDDSVGDFLSTSNFPDYTGDPTGKYYANPALWLYYQSSANVNNLRFLYCQEGLRVENSPGYTTTISHAQLIKCLRGIVITGCGSGCSCTAIATVNNMMVSNVTYPLTMNVVNRETYLNHCTFDTATRLITVPNSVSTTAYFTNSIFANITALTGGGGTASLSGGYNGFFSAPLFGNSSTRWSETSSPFLTAGQGSHYLKSATVFRSKGTTGIASTLVADLKIRTTQAPTTVSYPTSITEDTLWSPTVPRYVSGAPDLGYWYDPVDYLVSQVFVVDADLNIAAGTTVAYWPNFYNDPFFGPEPLNFGIILWNGSTLQTRGTPLKLTRLISTDLVQENSNPSTPFMAVNALLTWDGYPQFPSAYFRFTDFGVLGNFFWYHFLTGDDEFDPQNTLWDYGEFTTLQIQDSQIRSGRIWLEQPYGNLTQSGSFIFQNTLFERVITSVYPDSNLAATLDAHNQLFKGGQFNYGVPWGAATTSWVIKDNLFDQCPISLGGDTDNDNNGYYPNSATVLTPSASNNKLLTTAPAYVSSSLGRYYLATSSPLWNAGSRTPGAAGLYHFTTRSDQVKDGDEKNTTPFVDKVNIGLHYVSLVSGLPKDTDADGLPDFYEDANGNGIADDTYSWLLADTNSNGTNDGAEDPDADGITNASEYALGTDPLNPFEDYDHDGNNNALEKYLGTNPLVVDNPIQLAGYSNGATLPAGDVSLQVTIASGYTPVALYLLVDGEAATDIPPLAAPFANPPVFTFNSGLLQNGAHRLQAKGIISRNADAQKITQEEAVSPVLNVNVANEISFAGVTGFGGSTLVFPWEDDFSSVLQINATAVHFPMEYKVEIYNGSNQLIYHTPYNNYSNDGVIDMEWDLSLDAGGYYSEADGSSVYAKITTYYPDEASYTAQAAGSGTSGAVRTPKSKKGSVWSYPDHGSWIVADQDIDPDPDNLQPIYDGLAYGWDSFWGFMDDNYVLPYPWESTRDYEKAMVLRYGSSSAQDVQNQTADWNALRAAIPKDYARNIWLFAHGSPSSMGGDYDGPRGSISDKSGHSYITSGEVADSLGFFNIFKANHYYRFVFLDGCSTAPGDWPQSFGIKKKRITDGNFAKYYLDSSGNYRRRPSAFCGWLVDKTFSYHLDANEGFKAYRRKFLDTWLQTTPAPVGLEDAHATAKTYADQQDPPHPGAKSWGADLAIYGYVNLLFDQFNWQNPAD